MINELLGSNWMQVVPAIFTAGCILTGFRMTFKHHERILNQHEKRFEKHEMVIDGILKRLEAMNTEFTFMKGWISGKNQ